MICAKCGETVSDEARFCRNCGATLAAKSEPVPTPEQRPLAVTSEPSSAQALQPDVAKPKAGLSSKKIILLILLGFLLIAGAGIALWLTFFPPGVYVRDSFRKPKNEILSQIQDSGARLENGMLEMEPPNEKFYSISYKDPISDQSTIEATIIWKGGDEYSTFGILCCDAGNKEFIAFLISGQSYYHLASHSGSDWYGLVGWLKLPKGIKIQKNVAYEVKMVMEKDYVSLYLGETLLAKIVEDYEHRGMPGLYAEGGKTGKTVIAFDEFEAKKNSIFQSDNPSK
jgi:zinc-ribbon domain